MIYSTFYKSLIEPALVCYTNNLIGAHFPIMKIVPADFVLSELIRTKRRPKYAIEISSGTAALAIAYAAREHDLHLVIVGDQAVSGTLRAELESLDVELHLVSVEAGKHPGGYQKACLDALNRILGQRPGGVWLRRYDNPMWCLAYRGLAAALTREFGRIDTLVATTSSGASSCGTIAGLRLVNPSCKLVGIDTPGSILFGAKEAPRRLRGLGQSIMPVNLDHAAFDSVFWVSARYAWTAAHNLHSRHGTPGGPTSGAAWAVARIKAEQNPEGIVAFIGPDNTRRYEPQVFSAESLKVDNLWLDPLPSEPVEVEHPALLRPDRDLQHFRWGRRRLEQVMNSYPAQIDFVES
jgi:S-sulfo-L-cysteine synthase (3-phospho-L-serine-dependent)